MSERILQVVEEVKQASIALSEARQAHAEATEVVVRLYDIYMEAKDKYTAVERKLRGVIYEETQT